MQKRLAITLFFIHVFFFACMVDATVKKPWTFLVYLAAANDLNPFAALDIQEMMRVGSNDNLNVIVYLTVQEDGQQKETKKLYIEQGSFTQIGATMQRDSGDVATLQEALEWACVDYPSDHIAVVLWDHGDGPLNRSLENNYFKGVCYDFDTSNYLTDRDCLHAFSWARDFLRGGKKFDIIAFDACLLASLEMAYTLASCAEYMVASEETIPGDGYQYASILNYIATQQSDALSFARFMVRAYKQEYAGMQDYTLSAVDLNGLQLLVDNCNAVAQVLASQLRGNSKVAAKARATIKKCIATNSCISFDQGIYVDLYQLYKNLLKKVSGLKLSKSMKKQFAPVLSNGIKLLSSIIKANVTSSNYKNAGGLSVYFSRNYLDSSYYDLYWTEKNPQWLHFLKAYLA